MASTLEAHRHRSGIGTTAAPQPRSIAKRGVHAAAIAIIVGAAIAGGWLFKQRSDARWLRTTVIPQIQRLTADGKFFEAFERVRDAQRRAPADPDLAMLLGNVTHPVSVASNPPGADVSVAAYNSAAWIPMGRTPLVATAMPRVPKRLRVAKAGFAIAEDLIGAPPSGAAVETRFDLIDEKLTVPRMVRVDGPGDSVPMYLVPGTDPVDVALPDFWIDRYEVTNREFKAFVDAGGYRTREFWQHEFVKDGRVVSWEHAMASFRDATGRPGPATWQVGAYSEGQDDYPVTGVSWYEAAAYARFAGKSLLTLPHFYRVAGYQMASHILQQANLAGKGVARVGSSNTWHRFGAQDLAGNVKEWVGNPAGGDLRYILGGAWDEPPYMFSEPDARSAFERAANFGFRCARYDEGDRSAERLGGFIERPNRDYAAETPAAAPVFDAYRRFFAYDRTPVKGTVAGTTDSQPDWRIESVTFPAPYSGETIAARLYLPRNAQPPFQAVVFMTGAGAWNMRASPPLTSVPPFAHVVRSGRVVVAPVVKGTFERGTDQFTSTTPKTGTLWRDHIVAYYRDLARTLDYLESRADIDRNRIGFLGYSRGAALSPILLALEPQRIKVAALMIPGFYLTRQPPEVDIINFLPRVTQPVLMLNGRFDFIFPELRSQVPFFDLLGTPADRKRRVVYDTGHNVPQAEAIKETLDWLDRHLGPIRH